jgi:hypothetical protein
MSMKQIYLAGLAALLAVVAVAPAVWAGIETGPKVALHVTAATSKVPTICNTWSPVLQSIPCSNFVTEGSLGPPNLLVYLVVAQVDTVSFGEGVAGVNLGIEYNGQSGVGVDVFGWTLCADGQEYRNAGPRGDWPAAGGGNLITWATCQNTQVGTDGIHAVVGAFTVFAYTDDKMRLTPNRNLQAGPTFALANCSAVEIPGLDTLIVLGAAGFGTCTGCNPCTSIGGCPVTTCVVPVAPTTWGKIKSLYRP